MKPKVIAAGVLPICSSTGRILLVRRSIEKGNNWAMFGGKFDEEFDKSPKDTAKREFVEESGFSGAYKLSKDYFYVNEDNHISFYTYLGIFPEEFTPCGKDHSREHVDFGWFNLEEIPENLHHELGEMMLIKKTELQEKISQARS